MDVLKAEIANRKQKLEALKGLEPGKKFFRRGDLERDECKPTDDRQPEEGVQQAARPVSGTAGDKTTPVTAGDDAEQPVVLKPGQMREIVRRLRERGAPVRLFGESDAQVFKRLKTLESESADMDMGFKNELKLAMDKAEQEYINDAVRGAVRQKEGRHDVRMENCDLTYAEIVELSAKLEKGNYDKQCELVHSFFNFLLYKWGLQLNERSEEEKRSAVGRKLSATHTQTREYLQPLFRALSLKSVNADILEHLVSITQSLLEKDYIQANNRYMQMAIGNAPWPVGVTASGIHKRPGSEKLYVRNVAHVLNDEVQRKYIQALKRLLTKCQAFYPTDPSKSVEYVAQLE